MAEQRTLRKSTSSCLSALPFAVKERRLALGLTQPEAAKQIGVVTTDLCRFERHGIDVRVSTALKYLDWLEANDA